MDRRGKTVGVQRRYKGKRLTLSMAQAITMQSEMKKSSKDNAAPSQSPAPPREKVQIKSNVEDRVSHCAWHPKENTFAIAKASSLFIYTEKRRNSESK